MQVRHHTVHIALASLVIIGVPLSARAATLNDAVAISATQSASLPNQSFTLIRGSAKWRVPASEVRTWYKVTKGGDSHTLQLRPGAIYNYLNVHVSPRVNNTGEASRFIYQGTQLQLLSGGRKGSIVDGIKTSLAIRDALIRGSATATVAMKTYRPAVFSAADFQKIKFPDVLARGETNFAGSPANRVHNIRIATNRFNGLIIMPGEEFSFNQYLGTVDASNGYLPELVIKENVTTPEYGGGICQVSTTVFRAALAAGLDITNRRNHSYPVRYYGTPGFDATVYAPTTDFRFRNDTAHPVYLTTAIQGTRLSFEIKGTKDGRAVTVNGPFVTERRPDGSLTAAVAQIVKKGGKSIREENFVSRYQSPDKFPTVRAANGG